MVSSVAMTATDIHRTIDAVWRIESATAHRRRSRAWCATSAWPRNWRRTRWSPRSNAGPKRGVPDQPGAWLMATAKHRAIDRLRRSKLLQRKHEELGARTRSTNRKTPTTRTWSALDDPIGDDLLRLVFTACHPVLSTPAQVALTLRLLGGLTTDEIARAFLVPEATIAQRIVRAKRTLADKQVPYEVPRGEELAARLSSVLAVVYLIFNEGYSATAGDDWMRPGLCEDALRLGRILAGLVPNEPEVHGLVALMEIQASRAAARVDAHGEPVLLLEQNRARWDQLLIRRGLAALERAEKLGSVRNPPRGPYTLQAAIAACHARALTAEDTDWASIVGFYGALARITPSPVVELNRAVALSMLFGPAAGLAVVDALTDDPMLKDYHLLPSVRGDLLRKLGRFDEARTEFERAAGMTRNAREQTLLRQRAAECAAAG